MNEEDIENADDLNFGEGISLLLLISENVINIILILLQNSKVMFIV